MKNELILAAHQHVFAEKTRGVIDRDDLIINNEDVIITQREVLESTDAFRQFIDYTALRNRKGEFLLYQRTKVANEKKLHGSYSIGFGGHVELDSIVCENNVINILATLKKSSDRELEEEVGLTSELLENHTNELTTIGWLVSDGSEVDTKHVALLNIIDLSDECIAKLDFSEEDQDIVGWVGLDELEHMELESWSEQLVEHLAQ